MCRVPHAPLTAAVNRARAVQSQGDLVNGRALLEDALEDARRALGKSHDEVLDAALVLGGLHTQADDPAAARRVLEDAYAAGQLRLGDEDVRMLTLSAAIGEAAEELGNRHEAKRAYLRVARLGPATVGVGHPMVTRARAYLGDAAPPLLQTEAGVLPAAAPGPAVETAPPTQLMQPQPEPPTMPFHQAPPPLPDPPTAPLHQTRPAPPEPQTMPVQLQPVQPQPVQPVLPDPPTTPMHQSSAPPYQQSAPPAQQSSAPPYQNSAPPYQQQVPPYQNSAPPYQQSGPPYQQQSSAPPYQQSAPPYPQYPPPGPQYPPHPQSGPPYQQGYPTPVPPLHADPGAQPRPARTAIITVAVAVVAAVVAAAVTVGTIIATRGGDETPGPAATAPAGTPGAPQVAGQPPGDVRLIDDGEAIALSWTDPTDGTVSFIVAGGRAGEEMKPLANLPPGRVQYEINGLNPDLDYCFTVVAVYGTNASQVAASEQRCTTR